MGDVVLIRNAAPLLTDIPGMLRRLADQIEAGKHGEIHAGILLLPVDGDYPKVFGWGDLEGKNEPVIQCEFAKMWLLTHMVQRG